MGDFTITENGEVTIDHSIMGDFLAEAVGVSRDLLKPMRITWKRKKITMYASNLCGAGPRNGKYIYYTKDGSDYISITYVVQIRNGKVSSIKEQSRHSQPAEKQ